MHYAASELDEAHAALELAQDAINNLSAPSPSVADVPLLVPRQSRHVLIL